MGDRESSGMGEGNIHLRQAVPTRPLCYLAMQKDPWSSQSSIHDLHVGPAHALAKSGSECFEHRFLAGKAPRHVLVAAPLALAVGQLAVREQGAEDVGIVGYEPGKAIDRHNVDTDANPHISWMLHRHVQRPYRRGFE